MAWLLRDGEVLASVEVMASRAARMRGLIGRRSLEGAVLLRPARAVHTVGVRFPLDVAFCDSDLVVVDTLEAMPPGRITVPRLRAQCVLEAEAGSLARWGVHRGDQLELKG